MYEEEVTFAEVLASGRIAVVEASLSSMVMEASISSIVYNYTELISISAENL